MAAATSNRQPVRLIFTSRISARLGRASFYRRSALLTGDSPYCGTAKHPLPHLDSAHPVTRKRKIVNFCLVFCFPFSSFLSQHLLTLVTQIPNQETCSISLTLMRVLMHLTRHNNQNDRHSIHLGIELTGSSAY